MPRTLELRRADGGPPLWRLEVADSWWQRLKGLIGRGELRQGVGLYLTGTKSIHMLFMRFPIDAVFLDRDLRVVGVNAELRPWRIAGRRGARAVLEVAAGEAARHAVEIGERLVLREEKGHDATQGKERAEGERRLARSHPPADEKDERSEEGRQ